MINDLFDDVLKTFKILNSEKGVFTELSFLGREYELKNNGFAKRTKRELPVEGYKTCLMCGKTLPLDDFYNNRKKRDGKCIYCKKCYLDRYRPNKKKSKKKKTRVHTRSKEVVGHMGKFRISKSFFDDFIDRYGDGKLYDAFVLKNLFKKHRPNASDKTHEDYISRFLNWVSKQPNIKYFDNGKHGKKRVFSVSAKIVKNESLKKGNSFFSDGRFPWKPNADGDRKFMKGGE